MNNWFLLIIGIVLIGGVLIPLNYNTLTNHYRYTIPITNSEIEIKTIHIDELPLDPVNLTRTQEPLIDIMLLDDDTINVKFRNHGNIPPYPLKPFDDFERNFKKGDSFMIKCHESYNHSGTFFGLYEYIDIIKKDGEITLNVIHVDATSKKYFPCDFPQVIDYSINEFSLQKHIENYKNEMQEILLNH